jgi:protein gp37
LPFEGLTQKTDAGVNWTGKVAKVHSMLDEPFKWKNPERVFVNSMSDLFHSDVPNDFIEEVFAVMAIAKHHTFMILTKRPERMLEWFENRASWVAGAVQQKGYRHILPDKPLSEW